MIFNVTVASWWKLEAFAFLFVEWGSEKAWVLITVAFFAWVSQKWSQREPGCSRAIWQCRQWPALLHKPACTLKLVWFALSSVHPFRAKSANTVTPPEVRWHSACHVSRINWFQTRLAEGRESEAQAELRSVSLQPTDTGNEVSWAFKSTALDLPQEMHHVTSEVRDVDVVMAFRHFIPKRGLSVNPCFYRADTALTPPSLSFWSRSDLEIKLYCSSDPNVNTKVEINKHMVLYSKLYC